MTTILNANHKFADGAEELSLVRDYYDSDDVCECIGHLRIYHAGRTDQYKVRHQCEVCGLDLGCYCYDDIESAIHSCEEVTWKCMRHMLRDLWSDCELEEEIDNVCGTNLKQVVDEDHYTDQSKEITRILESITEEQANKILLTADLDDVYDMSHVGELCRT